jgi:hypothetical protein
MPSRGVLDCASRTSAEWRFFLPQSKKENGGAFPPRRLTIGLYQKFLAEQFEHRLVRLVGDGQCGDFKLLLGLFGQQVSAFLVLVGDN